MILLLAKLSLFIYLLAHWQAAQPDCDPMATVPGLDGSPLSLWKPTSQALSGSLQEESVSLLHANAMGFTRTGEIRLSGLAALATCCELGALQGPGRC